MQNQFRKAILCPPQFRTYLFLQHAHRVAFKSNSDQENIYSGKLMKGERMLTWTKRNVW